MAWLQNLAGKAENLLNKIDQNAATVLNDSVNKNSDISVNLFDTSIQYESEQEKATTSRRSSVNSLKIEKTATESPFKEFDVTDSNLPLVVNFNSNIESKSNEISTNNSVDEAFMRSDKSSNSSANHSFSLAEEIRRLNEKIAKIEFENQDLNKQLLNIQHLYSQLRNENNNLQNQLERVNEQLQAAQNEKDQYIARAQRILQEKEKLISLKEATNTAEEDANLFATYNEELKKELEFHEKRANDLQESNRKLNSTLQSLQMQHQVIQNGLNQNIQRLEESLLNEKKFRQAAEDECQLKINEIYSKAAEIAKLQQSTSTLEEKIRHFEQLLKQQKSRPTTNEDLEASIKSLTQTLMLKQNSLETVTTERNALRLQFEKLEQEYKNALSQLQRAQVKVVTVPESEIRSEVPQFMRLSPMDAGVTRRVKQTYSTLDSISIKTGVFLRRYPFARVFVFCYMVLLHIWVLIILFLYAPSNR